MQPPSLPLPPVTLTLHACAHCVFFLSWKELWEIIGGDDQGQLQGLFTEDGVVPMERWRSTLEGLKLSEGPARVDYLLDHIEWLFEEPGEELGDQLSKEQVARLEDLCSYHCGLETHVTWESFKGIFMEGFSYSLQAKPESQEFLASLRMAYENGDLVEGMPVDKPAEGIMEGLYDWFVGNAVSEEVTKSSGFPRDDLIDNFGILLGGGFGVLVDILFHVMDEDKNEDLSVDEVAAFFERFLLFYSRLARNVMRIEVRLEKSAETQRLLSRILQKHESRLESLQSGAAMKLLRKEMLDNMDTDGDGFIVKEEMAANREQIPTAANKLLALIVNIPRGGSVNYAETAHLHFNQVHASPLSLSLSLSFWSYWVGFICLC